MLVYRIENEDGIGPYKYSGAYHIRRAGCEMPMIYAHNDTDHPSPLEEGLFRLDTDCCAFTSIRKLRIWFRCWLTALHKHGFKLAVYAVPDLRVKHGKHQCLFPKDRARLIARGNIFYMLRRYA